jgi:hypothetical protein
LILTNDDGSKIIKIKIPQIIPQHSGDTIDFIAAIAMRRANRTRNIFFRETLNLLEN